MPAKKKFIKKTQAAVKITEKTRNAGDSRSGVVIMTCYPAKIRQNFRKSAKNEDYVGLKPAYLHPSSNGLPDRL
jgi:hypothetical protein